MFGFFSKGKINILIEKFNFSPGETIEGKVSLSLKKTIDAKGVYVELLGQERVIQGYGNTRNVRYNTIFNFKQPLDGEKQYRSKQEMIYDFEIKIPQDVLTQKQVPNDTLGAVVKTAQFLGINRNTLSSKIEKYGIE